MRKKTTSRETKIKRSCYILQTGTVIEKETERIKLVKNKLVGTECLFCVHFLGNYRGLMKAGIPVDSGYDCLGKSRGNCLYGKEEEWWNDKQDRKKGSKSYHY